MWCVGLGGQPLRIEGGDWNVASNQVLSLYQGGPNFQVTNTAANGVFHRFDWYGRLITSGTPLSNVGGTPLAGHFVVTRAGMVRRCGLRMRTAMRSRSGT